MTTSTGTLTDDLRPQSILKQQPPAPSETYDRRSLYSSNKSLNEYNNGSVTVGIGTNVVTNCQQHTPKRTVPVRHQEPETCFSDNLRHASLITHSNSELNQVCPHGKGSSKSK